MNLITKILLINILLVLSLSFAYAKGTPTDTATIKVDISRSSGSTYGTKVSKTFSCGADNYYYYYMDTTNWISGSVNDVNFRARAELDAKTGAGQGKIDHFEVNVFYTQEPTLTWADPTPNDNEYITGYQPINISSNIVISYVILSIIILGDGQTGQEHYMRIVWGVPLIYMVLLTILM